LAFELMIALARMPSASTCAGRSGSVRAGFRQNGLVVVSDDARLFDDEVFPDDVVFLDDAVFFGRLR